MSARQSWGTCPIRRSWSTRYRNRPAARAALDTTRRVNRANGVPEPLRPVGFYRCPPRDQGGCGGWHLEYDRQAAEEFIRGQLGGGDIRRAFVEHLPAA